MSSVATRHCTATTKAGNPCRNTAVGDDGRCIAHSENPEVRSRFGGAQPGAGRPRIPKPSEIALELVEAEAERLVQKTIDRALNAERALVSQSKGILGYEPDHAAQQRATEFLVPYVLGKPVLRTEVTGAGGGPVSIAHLVLSLNDVNNDVEVHGGDDGRA